jgi:hypothetical protein
MADLTKVRLATMGWDIMNHISCSPDLTSSDINLFRPVRVHLRVHGSLTVLVCINGNRPWRLVRLLEVGAPTF